MKDPLSLIITVAALAFVALRVYQKYFKKENKEGSGGALSKEDDYEPYSHK